MKIFRTRAFAGILRHAASLIPHVRTIREARFGIGFTNRLILQRRYTLSPTTANEPSFNLQSPFYSTLISSIFQTFFPRQKVSQPCKKPKKTRRTIVRETRRKQTGGAKPHWENFNGNIVNFVDNLLFF